jgi:hypothetical protein
VQGGTAEVSGSVCLLWVCAGGEASIGPQIGVEAAIGKQTKAKVHAGVVGLGAFLEFQSISIPTPQVLPNDEVVPRLPLGPIIDFAHEDPLMVPN